MTFMIAPDDTRAASSAASVLCAPHFYLHMHWCPTSAGVCRSGVVDFRIFAAFGPSGKVCFGKLGAYDSLCPRSRPKRNAPRVPPSALNTRKKTAIISMETSTIAIRPRSVAM